MVEHRDSEMLPETQELGAFSVGDANLLPTLTRPHERGMDQLQAAPFIKKARDDLRSPPFFFEAPLNQIGRTDVLPMRDREP